MADWLVADVGGTNTRVGLADTNGLRPETARSFGNAGFDGLDALLAGYLQMVGVTSVDAICAGVAGPVMGDTAQLTNFDWHIDALDLRAATGADDIHLMNDLQAQGYALDDLADGSVEVISGGQGDGGPRLVLGLGTGCNIAAVHRVGGDLFVPPSESGHTSLPHADGDIGQLCAFLQQQFSHAPIESALSGPGLALVHEWVTGQRLSPQVVLQARDNGKTVQAYSALLGLVAGNLCLAHMATGGLYLIGGMARAIASRLNMKVFRVNFDARGPYEPIMRDIPVHLISDDWAALRGAARFLRQSS